MDTNEVYLEEYKALRFEICQSIAKQHQILLIGYGLTSSIVGYLIAAKSIDMKAFVVVPITLLAMISLWSVECNRMVRASYYIGFVLWPKFPGIRDGWETWIRLKVNNEGDFRKRQDHLQQIVVVWIPLILSTAAMYITIVESWANNAWLAGLSAFGALLLATWFWVFSHVRKISDLSGVIPEGYQYKE